MFDSVLRSLLGKGQEQAYDPQLPGQKQLEQQQMPQQQWQMPSEWLALIMNNSGESFSDTLAKAAAITHNQQKVENENYEMQMKQQQMLMEQERAKLLAEEYAKPGGPSLKRLLQLTDPKKPEQAAALYAAQQQPYMTDMLGRQIPIPRVGGLGGEQPPLPSENIATSPLRMAGGGIKAMPSKGYGSPLEEKLDLEEKYRNRELEKKQQIDTKEIETRRLDKWKGEADEIDNKIKVAEKNIKLARGLSTQFTSGKYAESKKSAGEFFAPVSSTAEKVASDIGTFDTTAAKSVFESIQQLKGLGPASDRDIAIAERQVISSKNQPGTNKSILDMHEAILTEIKEMNSAKRKWIEANGTDNGFQEFWEKHMAANPVLDIDDKGQTRINTTGVKTWKKEFGTDVKALRKEKKVEESKTEDDYLKDIIRQKYPDFEG